MKDWKPPLLELSDVVDIKTMTREELDKVPFDVMFWFCAVNHCHSYSRVRDYGLIDNSGKVPITREFYWPRTKDPWIDVFKCIRICGRHMKQYELYRQGKQSIVKVVEPQYPISKDLVSATIKMYKEEQLKLL